MTDSLFIFDRRASQAARRADGERFDSLHRVMTGQALTRGELKYAGFFIATWFLMDLVQWVDWLAGKFR